MIPALRFPLALEELHVPRTSARGHKLMRLKNNGEVVEVWTAKLTDDVEHLLARSLELWRHAPHPALAVPLEAGVVDGQVRVLTAPPDTLVDSLKLALRPVRAARVVKDVVDALRAADEFAVAADASLAGVALHHGRPRLLLGLGLLPLDVVGRGRFVVDLAARVFGAGVDAPVAALGDGTDLDAASQVLAAFLADRVRAKVDVDDALAIVRRSDIHRCSELVLERPELLDEQRVVEEIMHRHGTALLARLSHARRANLHLLEVLPFEDELIQIVVDADMPQVHRATAAQVLGARGSRRAVPALTQVLNEPLAWLNEAAAHALRRIPVEAGAVVERDPWRIVPCPHDWHELMPMSDSGPDAGLDRFCADCDRVVVRVRDVDALAVVLQDPHPDDDIKFAVGTADSPDFVVLRAGDSMIAGSDPGARIRHPQLRPHHVRVLNAGRGEVAFLALDAADMGPLSFRTSGGAHVLYDVGGVNFEVVANGLIVVSAPDGRLAA